MGESGRILTPVSNIIEIERLKSLASSQKMNGDFAGALKARQALEAIYDDESVDPRHQVQNLQLIANMAVHLQSLAEAKRSARKCVTLSTGISEESKATCLMLLSCVLAESAEFEEATVFAERAIEIFESIFGPDSDFVAHRKNDLNRMRLRNLGGYLDR